MSSFEFDPNVSPEQNIELFFSHLASVDAGMTKILKERLSLVHPLPEAAGAKSTARKSFHDSVQAEFRKLIPTDSKEK